MDGPQLDLGFISCIDTTESFIGFHEVIRGTASELRYDIVSSIESNGLQLFNCRGQGYDGAANMSGIYSGVQARITDIEPTAKCILF